MKILFPILLLLSSSLGFSQIPDSILFDWKISGSETILTPEKKLNVLDFGFKNDGKFDNTILFQNLINTQKSDSQIVIHFPAGNYKFSSTIFLKSGIIIEGEGATKTKFMFDNGGNGNLFEISSTQSSSFMSVKTGLNKHSKKIEADGELLVNNYYELLVDGDGLATSDWAMNSIGQIFKIDSIKNNIANLSTELKLDYYNYKNPRIRLINPIRDVQFRFFSMERLDQSTGQTNNFNFNYAVNCSVKGVESNKSNMSHLTFSKSYRCSVADCYFHHAFDYGGGGKAYGVELSYSCSNCLVENTIFENVRHAVLLQSGANGNVISGNYSLNPFWNEGIFPTNSAGELVLHGNYPFANLFEGNQVGNIVVDNSHGYNGPGNVFYRNRASVWGILMSSNAGNYTHFIGNEVTGTLNMLTGLGNVNFLNYTNTTDTTIFKNASLPVSLYLKDKPIWWPTKKPYPVIGLPKTKLLKDIPAKFRYNHDSMRALNSSPYVFIVNFKTSFQKIKDQLFIKLESKLQVNNVSLVIQKFNQNQKVWVPITGDLSNGFLFQNDTLKDTVSLINDTTCYRWYASGMKKQIWISDSFCADNKFNFTPVLIPDNIKVYPNPTYDYIKIKIANPASVKLYSMVGLVVFSQNFNDKLVTLNISHLTTACYIIEVFDGFTYYRQLIQKQ